MKALKIVRFGDISLRKKTKKVTVFNKYLHETIDRMKETLRKEKSGAALAANQVGISKSIIVVNYQNEEFELINPRITSSSGEQYEYEGCLSLPNFSGRVRRAKTVKVVFEDRNGSEKEIERTGPLAICFQHEIDHLDGILFIDRMEEKFVIRDADDTRLKVDDLLSLTKVSKEEA